MRLTACRIDQRDGRVLTRIVEMDADDLSPGNVLVRVEWSGINYKDALAVTGRGRVVRTFPVNAGCDAAGTVLSSSDPRFAPGDPVIVGGMSLSEQHDGGWATLLRVPADWIVPMPAGLTARDAMVIGTAGFSAALAIHRMETLGQRPDLGPVVVTGASGGVGSFAVGLLASRGYEVVAVSGRPEHASYLASLGAGRVCRADDLHLGARPLESGRFGGVVDNVGGELLGRLLAHVRPWGNVAAVGNAGGTAVDTTVFPFIIRGVSLIGGSSANCPMALRVSLWERLGREVGQEVLQAVLDRVVPLESVLEAAEQVLDRKVRGRVLVGVGSETPHFEAGSEKTTGSGPGACARDSTPQSGRGAR